MVNQDLNGGPRGFTGSAPPPAGPPVVGTQPGKRSRGSLIAIVAAGFALIVALTSAAISWRALDQANVARDIANARGLPAPAPTVGESADTPAQPTAATQEPVDTGETEPAPTLNAQTRYEKKYTGESLKLQTSCTEQLYIDLDEPRLRVESGKGELLFDVDCGGAASTLQMAEGVIGSELEAPPTTPTECNEHIRTSPLGTPSQPVRRGKVYCFMTNLDTARASGDTWKMVVVEIKSTAQDGTVTINADAWNIPD